MRTQLRDRRRGRPIASVFTPAPQCGAYRTSWAKTPSIRGALAHDDGKAQGYGHRRGLFSLWAEPEPDRRLDGQARRLARVSRSGTARFPRVTVRGKAGSGGSDAWCRSPHRACCELSSGAPLQPSVATLRRSGILPAVRRSWLPASWVGSGGLGTGCSGNYVTTQRKTDVALANIPRSRGETVSITDSGAPAERPGTAQVRRYK